MRKERDADKEFEILKVGMEAFDIFWEEIENPPEEDNARDENIIRFYLTSFSIWS